MNRHARRWSVLMGFAGCLAALVVQDAVAAQRGGRVRSQYVKREYRIPMRDGVKLFTAVYTPQDASASKTYPILMTRTCYSVAPYGEDRYRPSLGPNRALQDDGYIFVYQDVRGCFMSEGTFVNMRPHLDNKADAHDIDESSDTFDTISWLLQNVEHHNDRVGMWGISYPGFYAATGMIDAHPALKAVSPQAPIANWWYDDFHHHGAFFLPHSFNFIIRFGQPRPEPTTQWAPSFRHGTPDGYQFFMDLGSLKDANPKYMHNRVAMWNNLVDHPNYDTFWQTRNLLPHLHHVAPAVLVVGGWFDAEDLYGALNNYRQIEKLNPGIQNRLVMGPWVHGGWARSKGDHVGNIGFGSATSPFYQEHIETPFFAAYLKGDGSVDLPEATMFETGRNRWRKFDVWPPNVVHRRWYLAAGRELTSAVPADDEPPYDEFVSDPDRPVPFTTAVATGMTREYMTDDQRFAARRPDVLVYQTPPLDKPITLAGPITVDLRVSTSQSAADWVVKLIDVLPPDTADTQFVQTGQHLGGYQMMVRSEIVRGRFRNDPAKPEPFVPNRITPVKFQLQDVLHTFALGHRIMIQVQSTWFPLVDRNPQKYVDNIFRADADDFVTAVHRVYHSPAAPSSLEFGALTLPSADVEESKGTAK